MIEWDTVVIAGIDSACTILVAYSDSGLFSSRSVISLLAAPALEKAVIV
jgi:hypothetical protein